MNVIESPGVNPVIVAHDTQENESTTPRSMFPPEFTEYCNWPVFEVEDLDFA